MRRGLRSVAALAALAALAAAALATACRRDGRAPARSGSVRAALAWADSIERATAAAPAGVLAEGDLVAVGYLERLRLGLGSPFRLVERALYDSAVAAPQRARLAAALLARTAEGASHRVEPAALWELVGEGGAAAAAARRHLALVEGTVGAARDPRAGELAVRLAYALAAADGALPDEGVRAAVLAAALTRDRRLAADDAQRLAREGERLRVAPATLVAAGRARRRLRVEAPPLVRLSAAAEIEAVALAETLLERLRADAASRGVGDASPASPCETRPLDAHAGRWARSPRVAGGVPEPAVAVTLRAARFRVLGPTSSRRRPARARLLDRAHAEESLVAAYLVARCADGIVDGRAALAVLESAVALRALAQARVSRPAEAAEPADVVARRAGLARVRFGREVPAHWRAPLLRALEDAVAAFRLVFPRADFSGLRVHVGASAAGDRALALHDPSTRTLYLPPAAAGGTLAHELAHDLDWMAVRRGNYATDRSIRDGQARLARALARLTIDSLIPPSAANAYRPPHRNRPTEVFARNVDWLVAAALADLGRSEGHLTSVQDVLLRGHAGATPPDVRGDAGAALLEVLEDVAPPSPAAAAGYIARHGAGRALDAIDRLRLVLEVEAPTPPAFASALGSVDRGVPANAFAAAPDVGAHDGADDAGYCEAGTGAALARARASIEGAAALARARGLLRGWERGGADDATLRALRLRGPWAAGTAARVERELAGTLYAGARALRPPTGALDRLVRRACGA